MAVKRDKSSPWEFLWYALYAFAGLGLELVLMGGVEPALFGGTPPSRYTAAHTLLHWGMTMACWGGMPAPPIWLCWRPLSSEAARTLGGQSSGLAAFLCLFQAHRPRSRLTDPPAAFIIELSTRRGGLP